MALNFPNSPANGQIYVANNVIYTWNGYLWESSTAPGSKGQKGEIGDKGDIGPAGSKGDKGDLGAAGAKGDKGQDGAAAAKGDKGDKGFVGTQGVKGDKGERVTVWKGSSPPTDTNLLWFNTVDGNFLVYYDDGDTPYWVDASPTVVGDKGDKGQKGDTVLQLTSANVATYITTANLYATDVSISGSLTVTGNTTYINTTQLNVGDNVISLNADLPSNSAPTEISGITVNRGSSANVSLLWDESNVRWTIGARTLEGGQFTGQANTALTANVATTANNALHLGGQPASIYASTGKAIAMAIVFGG